MSGSPDPTRTGSLSMCRSERRDGINAAPAVPHGRLFGIDRPWSEAPCLRPLRPIEESPSESRPIQHLTDLECELGLGDRLFQEVNAFIEASLVNHCVSRISRHVKDTEMGSYLLGTPA